MRKRFYCFALSVMILLGVSTGRGEPCVIPDIPANTFMNAEGEADNGKGSKKKGSKGHKRSQFRRKT